MALAKELGGFFSFELGGEGQGLTVNDPMQHRNQPPQRVYTQFIKQPGSPNFLTWHHTLSIPPLYPMQQSLLISRGSQGPRPQVQVPVTALLPPGPHPPFHRTSNQGNRSARFFPASRSSARRCHRLSRLWSTVCKGLVFHARVGCSMQGFSAPCKGLGVPCKGLVLHATKASSENNVRESGRSARWHDIARKKGGSARKERKEESNKAGEGGRQ